MDFLDSLDLETNNKSQRVRSWYLYEQFKEIEKNQLDAAKKLKDKSYQDRILRQELAERKVRRSLYDNSETNSDSRLHNDTKYGDDSVLSPTEDLFESVADIHDESLYDFGEFQDDLSRVDFVVGHCFKEDHKSVEEFKDCNSCADSIRCFRNVESNDNIRNETKQMFSSKKFGNLKSNTDDSNYNFNEIEKTTQLIDDEKDSEISSLISVNGYDDVEQESSNNEIAAFAFWTKFVSFAYQIIKLNHGNCFYDYGSQFMTAVLICDVLRRGICKMCNILQPYVSPIKFADDIDVPDTKKHKNRAKLENLKKSMVFLECTPNASAHCQRFKRNRDSDKIYYCNRHRVLRRLDKNTQSEPWRSIPKFSLSKTYLLRDLDNSFVQPKCSRTSNLSNCEICECCHKKVSNPMLKIAQYMEDYLKSDTLRYI